MMLASHLRIRARAFDVFAIKLPRFKNAVKYPPAAALDLQRFAGTFVSLDIGHFDIVALWASDAGMVFYIDI
jgi:hypothetical protein